MVENQFERRLQPCEYPHSLYIANYSTAAATCLAVRRWLFHPKVRELIEVIFLCKRGFKLFMDQMIILILFSKCFSVLRTHSLLTTVRQVQFIS